MIESPGGDAYPVNSTLEALLAGHGLLTTLAGTSIAASPLPSHRQSAAMSIPAILLISFKPLDILLHLTTQGTFNDERGIDQRVDGREFLVIEVTRLAIGIYSRLLADFRSTGGPNAMDIAQE